MAFSPSVCLLRTQTPTPLSRPLPALPLACTIPSSPTQHNSYPLAIPGPRGAVCPRGVALGPGRLWKNVQSCLDREFQDPGAIAKQRGHAGSEGRGHFLLPHGTPPHGQRSLPSAGPGPVHLPSSGCDHRPWAKASARSLASDTCFEGGRLVLPSLPAKPDLREGASWSSFSRPWFLTWCQPLHTHSLSCLAPSSSTLPAAPPCWTSLAAASPPAPSLSVPSSPRATHGHPVPRGENHVRAADLAAPSRPQWHHSW